MDIKKTVTELIEKITKNPDLLESFKKDPFETIKKLVGVDISTDTLNALVEGVKAKIGKKGLAKIIDKIKSLF